MRSGSFHFLAGLVLISGLMLLGRPLEIYAIDRKSGYDSAGNYIDEVVMMKHSTRNWPHNTSSKSMTNTSKRSKMIPTITSTISTLGTCTWRSIAPTKPSRPSRKPCSSNPGTERCTTNWEKPTATPRTAKRRSNILKRLAASSRKTSTSTGTPRPETS